MAAMASTTGGLTSTTAPGKVFTTRSELAEHYKSDWHKYNLKRREAGLPMLKEIDFQARWEAALALRQEKEQAAGKNHIKSKKENKKANNNKNSSNEKKQPKETPESQENPEIDPKQSLFDAHMSNTLQENLDYMQKTYGFFIPDQECLTDLEGLLGYCQEKIKLGHICLYCGKVFPTWQGCQKHMISKSHTKLCYDRDDWEELDVFYDFQKDDQEYLQQQKQHINNNTTDDNNNDNAMEIVEDNENDGDDDDDWEDMSDNEEEEEDATIYDKYEQAIANFGLDVTPLGELVFPDGRIVGHRALRRYYKQRPRMESNSTAVVAAKQAAKERLYKGQNFIDTKAVKGVIAIRSGNDNHDNINFSSALSLYRYRAVVRKQRRDDQKGQRLQNRTKLNINRMDKKANRIMNGVSVAHAAR